jgi:hypothetical protein
MTKKTSFLLVCVLSLLMAPSTSGLCYLAVHIMKLEYSPVQYWLTHEVSNHWMLPVAPSFLFLCLSVPFILLNRGPKMIPVSFLVLESLATLFFVGFEVHEILFTRHNPVIWSLTMMNAAYTLFPLAALWLWFVLWRPKALNSSGILLLWSIVLYAANFCGRLDLIMMGI